MDQRSSLMSQTATAVRLATVGQGRVVIALSAMAAIACLAVGNAAGAASKPDAKPATPKAAANVAAPKPIEPPKGTLAEQYCQSVRDAASEARHAVQAAELASLQKELDGRLEALKVRMGELKDWLAQREAFANRATAQLVSIYAAMRPESASEQLAKIDEFTAAAVLSKLEARAASAILNDMPAEKAGRLATILAGASHTRSAGDRS